ncbi:DUF1120 domain-containing protein [Pseudomonas sp. NPDC086251]|uniref:DUF1120 domain-containing protein n=1 Tax=Pseudomonas sp. NPDC086251 TaxID=3364431 RepID=UPI003832786C
MTAAFRGECQIVRFAHYSSDGDGNERKTSYNFASHDLGTTLKAAAGPTAELKGIGDIQIGACTIGFNNGGTFDFGNIYITDAVTIPAAQPGTLLINCSAPIPVFFNITDNRVGTSTVSGQFGLGLDSAANPIGTYRINFQADALLDGASGWMLSGNGTTWQRYPGTANSFGPAPQTQIGFQRSYEPRNGTPQPFTTFAVTVSTAPSVQPIQDMDTSQSISLDGSATFELFYL